MLFFLWTLAFSARILLVIHSFKGLSTTVIFFSGACLSSNSDKNIHTLIRKLLQTNIPGTIIKFIANNIKGRKTYTTYRNHTSKQRQFKTSVPQGGVLSPTLFNIYTSDLPLPSSPVQVMAYADDITITSTHTSTSAAKKYIQPYLHKVFA